jgi:MFS family permease
VTSRPLQKLRCAIWLGKWLCPFWHHKHIDLITANVVSSIVIILLYVALLALGVALIIPSLAALVSKHPGSRPGAALGQLTAAFNLGQASGPAVGGVLFAWRIHAPYLFTALLLFATAAYWAMRNN